jgi:hypothetical protein
MPARDECESESGSKKKNIYLRVAQGRQKSYADNRRRELEFQVEMQYFLG